MSFAMEFNCRTSVTETQISAKVVDAHWSILTLSVLRSHATAPKATTRTTLNAWISTSVIIQTPAREKIQSAKTTKEVPLVYVNLATPKLMENVWTSMNAQGQVLATTGSVVIQKVHSTVSVIQVLSHLQLVLLVLTTMNVSKASLVAKSVLVTIRMALIGVTVPMGINLTRTRTNASMLMSVTMLWCVSMGFVRIPMVDSSVFVRKVLSLLLIIDIVRILMSVKMKIIPAVHPTPVPTPKAHSNVSAHPATLS